MWKTLQQNKTYPDDLVVAVGYQRPGDIANNKVSSHDPVYIAKAIGLTVQPWQNVNNKWDSYYDLIWNPPGIGVNSDKTDTRQRFSIAHALGHIILSHGDKKHCSMNNATDNNCLIVNVYAVELLMPAPEVKLMIHLTSSITKMATHFGVSREAMKIRMEYLGIPVLE